MKGKKLEIVVLIVAFLILSGALFLMFYGRGGTTADEMRTVVLVNRLFSLGFLVYIGYSYLLSTNLNNEIADLNKHVGNLKQEAGRLNKKIDQQNKEISGQKSEISTLESEIKSVKSDKETLIKQLAKANREIETFNSKSSKSEEEKTD